MKTATKDQIDCAARRLQTLIGDHIRDLQDNDSSLNALKAAVAKREHDYSAQYSQNVARRDRVIASATFGKISADELFGIVENFFHGSGC